MSNGIHDRIIEKMRAFLISKGYKVKTNPSNQKVFGVTGPSLTPGPKETYYPDVYTYDENKNEVTNIYEVETSETITDSQAEQQWRLYANGSAKFYLVVPKSDLERVKLLVQQKNIKVADYYTY